MAGAVTCCDAACQRSQRASASSVSSSWRTHFSATLASTTTVTPYFCRSPLSPAPDVARPNCRLRFSRSSRITSVLSWASLLPSEMRMRSWSIRARRSAVNIPEVFALVFISSPSEVISATSVAYSDGNRNISSRSPILRRLARSSLGSFSACIRPIRMRRWSFALLTHSGPPPP